MLLAFMIDDLKIGEKIQIFMAATNEIEGTVVLADFLTFIRAERM